MIKKQPILSIITLGFILSLCSCNSLQQLRLEKDKSLPISLGQIVTKEGFLKNNIETKGTPNQVSKLQVAVIEKKLQGSALTRFKKWEDTGAAESNTLQTYLEIELIDDIAYARALDENISLKNYIQQSKKSAVVTKIHCTSGMAKELLGKTVFLEIASNKEPFLVAYNSENKEVGRASFSTLSVFDYQVSYFCYGKDDRNQIAVMDLVEDGKHCKRPLERKVKNLTTIKKLVDY